MTIAMIIRTVVIIGHPVMKSLNSLAGADSSSTFYFKIKWLYENVSIQTD